MQLEELFAYKYQFMEDILTDETIVNLIDENVSVEDSKSLVYKNVYPLEYIPETISDGRTFVCIDVDIQSAISKTFYIPTIYVWVLSHRSKLVLPEGGVRIDKLCSLICKKMNGSRSYTLGELELASIRRVAPVTDYQGRVMVFRGKEINKLFDPTKTTPERRRATSVNY